METQNRIPIPLTPFFGRVVERKAILDLLRDPGCRLLTLTGPGGIGKTRLAIETARAALAAADYADGVYFIDLTGVNDGSLLPVAIRDALSIPPGQEPAQALLTRYLRGRCLLLVLDNFEHLVDHAALLTGLLESAPEIKMLITSREALHLQEEWLYPLGGMDLPPGENAGRDWREAALESSAVQMFTACARRARPDFSLDTELESVIDICRQVEAMPLAIELAASWTRVLRCAVIAREIRDNIRFLETNLRNIPERHRSIQAVFEQTWRMLSPQEQQAFKRLSVFRGGFDHAAAYQVAEASLAVMAALADKSLLRQTTPPGSPDGAVRFSLHELLRQYAQNRLAQAKDEERQTLDRHCQYYLAFLQQRGPDLLGGRQQAAVRELLAELDNVRAAWAWAVQQGRVDLLRYAVQPLDAFFQFQSRFIEGTELFEQTVADLEQHPPSEDRLHTQAQAGVCLGWFYIRCGHYEKAQQALESAGRRYAALTAPPPPGLGSDPLNGHAILALLGGDYQRALLLGEQALYNGQARSDPYNTAFSHYVLASASLGLGEYEAAARHAQQSCEISERLRDLWFLAYCMIEWGQVMRALGDTERARRRFEESYRLRESFNDPEGMALALNHLGRLALLEENFAEAARIFRQSAEIYTSIFDRGGLAVAYNGLAAAECGRENLAGAREHLLQGLRVAQEIHFIPLILSILNTGAELLARSGQQPAAAALLAFIAAHPAAGLETRRQAEKALAQTGKGEAGSPQSLEEAVQALLDGLQRLDLAGAEAGPPAAAPAASSGLVEELTEREVEILALMERGDSNQEIAERLVLSLGTIKWYTSQIYGKLQVRSRTQALARARELGIL